MSKAKRYMKEAIELLKTVQKDGRASNDAGAETLLQISRFLDRCCEYERAGTVQVVHGSNNVQVSGNSVIAGDDQVVIAGDDVLRIITITRKALSQEELDSILEEE